MNEKKWYAVYTRARNEKKVATRLTENNVRVYLPLQQTLKQWSDRKKKVSEPLFKSYVFVHIDRREHGKVMKTDGVVCFVTIGGELTAIPDNQIMAIRHYLQEAQPAGVSSHFKQGDRVEVIRGSLMGVQGEIVDFSGRHKVRIRIEGISQFIDVSIPASLLALSKV